MAFSFLDDSEVEEKSIGGDESSESGEESADDIVCTGMKRRRNRDFGDALVQFKAEETGDYIEKCARQAAVSAHMFWKGVMSPVSNIKSLISPLRLRPSSTAISKASKAAKVCNAIIYRGWVDTDIPSTMSNASGSNK